MLKAVSPLDLTQTEKAVNALKKILSTERSGGKTSLLEDVEYFNVQIKIYKSIGESKNEIKLIALPNPIYDIDTTDICVFTKDPQKEYRALFADECPQAKVIGIQKLRANHKSYESKRKLVATYDMFLAEKAIIPLLPPLLGKAFFTRRKQPAGITITKGNIASTMEKVLSSTRFSQRSGLCLSIRVGHSDQSAAEVAQNIDAVMKEIIGKYLNSWDDVSSLNIKYTNSITLPFYNSLPTVDSSSDENAGSDND